MSNILIWRAYKNVGSRSKLLYLGTVLASNAEEARGQVIKGKWHKVLEEYTFSEKDDLIFKC